MQIGGIDNNEAVELAEQWKASQNETPENEKAQDDLPDDQSIIGAHGEPYP